MKKVLCGVDIGGTKLSTALVDHDGNIIDKTVVYDHVDKPEDIFVEQVSLIISENGLYFFNFPGKWNYFPGEA